MNRAGYSLLGDEGYIPLRKELSPNDRKLLSKVFHRSDQDFKGYLTRRDLKVAVLELLGYKPCKEEVDGWITLHGDNETPGLSEKQFELAMTPKLAARDEDEDIRETFLAFDIHCRGFLREEDVERVFRQVAPHLPSVTVATVFREIDQDGDGRISFRDFQMMMKYDFDCHI